MNYTVSGAQLGKPNEADKAASINIKENKNTNENVGSVKSFQGVFLSGAQVNKDKLKNNTYKSLLKETDDVKQQIMASATAAKANLKALFNRLSGADAVEIDKDGFNLNDMTKEDMVGIVDKIKIELAAYCKDYKLVTAGSISTDQIEQVVGSKSLANEVENKLRSADVPATSYNVSEVKVALDKAEQIGTLSDDAKNYLVANRLEPTIDNVYMAEHFNRYEVTKDAKIPKDMVKDVEKTVVSDEEWEQLRPQIEEVIKEAGLEVNDDNLNNAKQFLCSNIPVTKAGLIYRHELDELNLSDITKGSKREELLDGIVSMLGEGKHAADALLTGKGGVISRVADAIYTLNNSDIRHVAAITESGDEYTIENLKITMGNIEKAAYVFGYVIDDSKVQSFTEPDDAYGELKESVAANYRQLQEARIFMTAQAGMFLVNKGINLNTTPISKLVDELIKYDEEYTNNTIAAGYDSIAAGNDTIVAGNATSITQVKRALFEIKNAPDAAIGAVVKNKDDGEALTINDFAEYGSNLRERFEQAGQSYEAVGTQVRKDLGDSMKKAVKASAESLLFELGMENSEANTDAVRILAANQMDITRDNVDKIKEIYSTLKNLIDNMKPDKVLDMIRNNINPVTDDIHVVNEYLTKQLESEKDSNDVNEKYSRFLYKLDKTNGITEDERKQFINIYKMINIFTKDAGDAIGALVKQNADITMANLCMAYASRKAYGMDEVVDDITNQKSAGNVADYYTNMFLQAGSKITPLTLKKVNDEQQINDRMVENFCEAVEENYDENEEAVYYEEYLEEMRRVTDAQNSIIRELEAADCPVTPDNIRAMENVMESGYLSEIFNGEKARQFIDKIGHKSDLDKEYDKLKEDSDKELKEAVENDENPQYKDIEHLRRLNKTIGLINNLSRRNDYKIPVMTKKGITAINLTLIQDEDDKGRVSVNFSDEQFGNVSVELKVNGDGAAIFAVSDKESEQFAEVLSDMADELKANFDMNEVKVHYGKSDKVARITYEDADKNVATDRLYKMAETVIREISGQM